MAAADLLGEFGDVLFWQTPLPEVAFFEVGPDEVNHKGGEETLRRSDEEDGVHLESGVVDNGDSCNDGDHHEDSRGNKNTVCNINMVLVQFTLNEQAMEAPEEVFDVVQKVEMLVKEKSSTFFATEWLNNMEGKMEMVMREKEEAEALVKQLNNTLWHPLLSLVVTLNVVPSLNKSSVGQKQSLKDSPKEQVGPDSHFSSPSSVPVSSSLKSNLQEQYGKTTKERSVREDLGGIMKKKKVTGRTSEEKVRQHMMNYIIEKIQRMDEKIRLTKEEQHLVKEEIEVLDRDVARLEEELEECRQNCPSRVGVVFPSMDIRYKVIKLGEVQQDLTNDQKLNLDQENQETNDNLAVEEEVEISQVVGNSDVEENLQGQTEVGSQSVLEGDILDVQSSNSIRETVEEETETEKVSKSCEKLVVEKEIVKHLEHGKNEKEEAGTRMDVELCSAALVCKGGEVIIDCDSD